MKLITEYFSKEKISSMLIDEYLSTKVAKSSIIKATNETIHQIVKNEVDRLGHDCDLNHIDVSEVTDMSRLFSCYEDDLGPKYNDLNPNISEWKVGNVEHMRYMFYDCKDFNQDISDWDVSNVKNTKCMFWGCEHFNKDLSRWDVSNIYFAKYMFFGCPIKQEFKPRFKIKFNNYNI